MIINPNLPDKDVSVVLMSGLHKNLCEKINDMGIKVIKVSPLLDLDIPENTHADMQCFHFGNKDILVAKNSSEELINLLEGIGMNIFRSSKELKPKYPLNVSLNCAKIGNKLFANIKSIDSLIEKHCKENNISIINVNQGYAKCSTAIVDNHSIITSDESIYKKAKENNIDVLKIRQGYINLPGYDYGFIGGCCGLISKDKILFTGDIKKHPDYSIIEKFISERKIKILCLTNEPLIDIGGIIPLC